MTAPYTRDEKSSVQNAELWMEFQNKRPQGPPYQVTYLAFIKPTSDNCDHSVQIARVPTYVHDFMRLRFNITSLYLGCDFEDLKYLQLSLRLKSEESGLDLSSSQADAFILLQEEVREDGSDLVSVASHETALEAFERLGRRRREAGGNRLKRRNAQENGSYLVNEDDAASRETTTEAFMPLGRRRRRREPGGTRLARRNRRGRLCRLQKWYVKFKDLGWDWVIAPPVGFQANRCHGKCSFPLTTLMNGTNHAVVQTLVNSIFGKPRGACCVAKELAPLTMLFLEKNGIIIMKMYPDMVVKSCACL